MKSFFKKQNKKRDSAGFTIMETLVAIFILLLATTGPMVFAQNGLRASFLSRDQITAFFLAQDVIEYIKNVRDGNVVRIIRELDDSSEWLDGLEDCIVGGQGGDSCSIDTSFEDFTGIKNCSSNSIPGCLDDQVGNEDIYTPLNYDTDAGIYTNSDSEYTEPSLFAREISIDEVIPGREAEVTVKIRWKSHEGIGVREIVVKENIFNWANALID